MFIFGKLFRASINWKDFRAIGVAPITQAMHMHNKNSNIQGRSLNVIKVFSIL